jgi:hypothetical protein
MLVTQDSIHPQPYAMPPEKALCLLALYPICGSGAETELKTRRVWLTIPEIRTIRTP